jgi:excisionase family DNA binding protein
VLPLHQNVHGRWHTLVDLTIPPPPLMVRGQHERGPGPATIPGEVWGGLAMTGNAAVVPLLLRPEEAAQRLGIGRSAVYQLMAEGRLKSVTLGRSRRVSAASVDELYARLLDESGGSYR